MNKNESTTAPGWYYYSTDDVNFPDGLKWIDDSITQADLDEMGITLIGKVPEPGTTFTIAQFQEWVLGKRITDSDGNQVEWATSTNRTFEFIAREIVDEEDGLAAVTNKKGGGELT